MSVIINYIKFNYFIILLRWKQYNTRHTSSFFYIFTWCNIKLLKDWRKNLFLYLPLYHMVIFQYLTTILESWNWRSETTCGINQLTIKPEINLAWSFNNSYKHCINLLYILLWYTISNKQSDAMSYNKQN